METLAAAAFLISCFNHLEGAVAKANNVAWVAACVADLGQRTKEDQLRINPYGLHAGFAGPTSLMGSDQGVRAVLTVFNAMCQVSYSELQIEEWELEFASDEPEDTDVAQALIDLNENRKLNDFLSNISQQLVNKLDWRTSGSSSLSSEQKQLQAAYRGSSGYSLLQRHCLDQLKKSPIKNVAEAAEVVSSILVK